VQDLLHSLLVTMQLASNLVQSVGFCLEIDSHSMSLAFMNLENFSNSFFDVKDPKIFPELVSPKLAEVDDIIDEEVKQFGGGVLDMGNASEF